MKKINFLLLLPFLASCASQTVSERQPAADNTVLFTCQTNNYEVVKHFFSKSEPPAAIKEGTTIQLTIGQDLSETHPLFEMRVDFLDKKGQQLDTPRNYKRLAYAESPDTGNVSITYSPSATYITQGARSFNVMITKSTAKLAFLQQNANNAYNRSMALDCDRSAEAIRMPKTVDFSKLNKDQKMAMIRILSRSLPLKSHYSDDDAKYVAPSFVNTQLENNIKEMIKSMPVTEEIIKKSEYLDKDAKVTLADANARCTDIRFDSYYDIRDMTGRIVARWTSVECQDVAATVVEKEEDDDGKMVEKTRKIRMQYGNFYVVDNEILTTAQTDLEFYTIYDEE